MLHSVSNGSAKPLHPPHLEPNPRSDESVGVVVIDDDEGTCQLLTMLLGREGVKVETFVDPELALHRIEDHPPHVVLTDLEMEGTSGLDVVERLGRSHPDLPVIVITGHADLEHAVGALRAGAYDFLTKPLDAKRLLPTVQRAAEHHLLRAEVLQLRERAKSQTEFASIIGRSRPMKVVFELIDRVAPTDASVLITGESGTGKELVARALHDRSGRAQGPFAAVNCAAVPANLIESELFGHTRGAFTDARSVRKGLFLEAQGGTLFLDEIGELPIDMQPKLLRALQERRIRPVGGDREVPFDARIVCSTNRDLGAEVAAGRFREDLFYRVNVVTIELPPLRERGNDILALAQHFVERISERYGKHVRGLGPDTAKQLLSYPWPGNVRELENCIDRAVALTRYDHLTLEDLPITVRQHEPQELPVGADDPATMVTLGELEARYIRKVLNVVKGNKSQAARVLGIDRRTLYRKIERLEEGAER